MDLDRIGDGKCDPEGNNPLCRFDNGDCCLHAIVGPDCPVPLEETVTTVKRECTCHKFNLDMPLFTCKCDERV